MHRGALLELLLRRRSWKNAVVDFIAFGTVFGVAIVVVGVTLLGQSMAGMALVEVAICRS
ncbi:hypothetical protein C2G38_2208712 [Gigaspora rosea]|uniref:Uncharacterized protein n=1 Tax=Gigaspora rosea TaxID=44941 RepID=A0A397UK77_9GLOM|nr:hypothetical protein C2G38_2208712 [Gigaspora rosea]